MIFGRLDSKRGWRFGVMHRGRACDDQRYQRDMRRMTLEDATPTLAYAFRRWSAKSQNVDNSFAAEPDKSNCSQQGGISAVGESSQIARC